MDKSKFSGWVEKNPPADKFIERRPVHRGNSLGVSLQDLEGHPLLGISDRDELVQ